MSWKFGNLMPLSYELIMADPAWCFETWSDEGKKQKSPEVHYDTMPLDEIMALPVGHLAAGDCVLWLWGTHPMIDQQIRVSKEWGFKFATTGVWVKRTRTGKLGFGPGYWLRSASEPFIIATMGSPKRCRSIRTVIEGPLREHSRKPDEAYEAAERLAVGATRRADLFSRESRPGWDSWGNETGKFDKPGSDAA